MERKCDSDDDENVREAIELIEELIELNARFYESTWVSAMLYLVIERFNENGLSYEQAHVSLLDCLRFYKDMFEEGEENE